MAGFWRKFAPHFVTYGVFITALGVFHGFKDRDVMAFLAWELVYLPLVAVLAAVLAYRTKD